MGAQPYIIGGGNVLNNQMKAILFKNFSNESFTYSFDSIPHTFPAGREMYMEDYKAEHFAKHLIDRELNRLGVPTNYEPKRKELLLLALPGEETIPVAEAINIEAKKEVKKKKVEEEFPDLKKKK